jgi:hypothetical protein
METQPPQPSQQSQQELTDAVGEKFLVHYYKCASENNASLNKFYKKHAVCTFGDSADAVVGPEKIGEKLSILKGAGFDLETGGITYAFQATSEGGVLVMVSGLVSLRDDKSGSYATARRFVQTFLLSRKDANTYSIANDMHRFVGTASIASAATPVTQAHVPQPAQVATSMAGESTAEKPSPAISPAAATPSPAPASAPVAPTPVAAPAPVAETKPTVPQPQLRQAAPAPKAEGQQKPARGAQTGANKPPQPPQLEAAPAAKPSGPPSYAQAAAKSSSSSPSQAATSASNNSLNTATAIASSKQDSAPQRSQVASPPPGCAVFVKNLGNLTKQALTDACKPFGTVVSVALKNGNAVVTFSEAKQVDAALAAKEITVDGQTLQIDLLRAPRPQSGSGSGRAGRSSGNNSGANSPAPNAAPGQDQKPTRSTSGGSSRSRPSGSQQQPTGGNRPSGAQPRTASPSTAAGASRGPRAAAPKAAQAAQ